MATARPFAYNSGGLIPGTEQIGNIAVGYPTNGFGSTGLDWWNGPDEETGYVVCGTLVSSVQPTQVPEDAIVISSTYKGENINLSNNNQTAFQQFGYQMSGLGENLISGTDKVMFSILSTSLEPLTIPGARFIGVGKTTMNYQGSPYGGYPGNDTNSIGFNAIGEYYYNGSVFSSGLPTWTQGDIIDIAISHGQGWFIRVNGGDWNNNPSADPTTLNGYLSMNGLTNYYPALCPGYEGTMTILNYPPYGTPSGYNFLGNKTAQIGFFRTDVLSDNAFIDMVSNISGQNFNNTGDCTNWLSTNGYWTSYGAFSSSITIPTNDGGGLTGWSNGALSVAYNPTLISEYPVGSTIVFQDGSTAIIIGYDPYAPNYIDIFWDTPKSGTLFPITIGVL